MCIPEHSHVFGRFLVRKLSSRGSVEASWYRDRPCQTRDETKEKRQRRRYPSEPSPAMLAILAVLGVVVLLTASGFTLPLPKKTRHFLASCHSRPECSFSQHSQLRSPSISLLPVAKRTHCIDCHSAEGVTGGSARLLGAHNALAFHPSAVQPAKLTQPFGESNCLKCHQISSTCRTQ